jgi:hypothetical protein
VSCKIAIAARVRHHEKDVSETPIVGARQRTPENLAVLRLGVSAVSRRAGPKSSHQLRIEVADEKLRHGASVIAAAPRHNASLA